MRIGQSKKNLNNSGYLKTDYKQKDQKSIQSPTKKGAESGYSIHHERSTTSGGPSVGFNTTTNFTYDQDHNASVDLSSIENFFGGNAGGQKSNTANLNSKQYSS